MGWEIDLVVYAILFVIFAVAKGNAKKICMLMYFSVTLWPIWKLSIRNLEKI